MFVSGDIIGNGYYEPKVGKLFKHLLEMSQNDANGKTVMIDVGANLGIHGLYAAKLGYSVWAVEPQEMNLIKVIERQPQISLIIDILSMNFHMCYHLV